MQTELKPWQQPRAPDNNVARDDTIRKANFENVLGNQRDPNRLRRSAEKEIQNVGHTLSGETGG
jgi:hypothetical protein